MKEIEFYFDWNNHKVIFSNGIICDIDEDKNFFVYKNMEFTLESDVEKDLCYAFNVRYVNITK
ncbi:MAG: hypothetical protein RR523_14280 [Cetobacterium sp.]|uniref:hypothetical protein n=1 Tax=Cetobacterium sp. TaxID=2071632 RepID=UPI002FC94983